MDLHYNKRLFNVNPVERSLSQTAIPQNRRRRQDGAAPVCSNGVNFARIHRMGIRGEVFSTRVLLKNRSYFFNVKENRSGDLYFNVVESKNNDSGGFERQSVIVFDEDLTEFLKGFDETLKVFEKLMREKRRTGSPARLKPQKEEPRYKTGKKGKILIARKKEEAKAPKPE
ncbi:MAG: DUF3276 family protein [Spirochaetaceae bacterium]|jgi:hypothetical protein|nr:DUF3276 family protein [Spirochaetaceae bacterium]